MDLHETPSPFTRSSATSRDAARRRVRTTTALGAAGALLGTGLLTVALVPGATTVTAADSTSTAVSSTTYSMTGTSSGEVPASLTDTADTTSSTTASTATDSSTDADEDASADTMSGGS